jgi:hypothetical protein
MTTYAQVVPPDLPAQLHMSDPCLPLDSPLFYGHLNNQLSPLELLTELEDLTSFPPQMMNWNPTPDRMYSRSWVSPELEEQN